MVDMLKTLAITVEEHISMEEIEAARKQAEEAAEMKMWIIILLVIFAVEIFFALLFPKWHKKYTVRKEEEARKKAERKRIQSQRKKEY